MAKKSTKKEEPQSNEPQTYEVKATRNLGATITGGDRIPAGKKGTITATPDRYQRLKAADLFE